MFAGINTRRLVETLSAVLFLLLFPGFYFYHQGVAAGFISGSLGGFFSPVCLLALILYMPFFGHWAKVFLVAPKYALLILAFLMWTALSALVTYGLYPSDYMNTALYQYMNVALIWVVLILVGGNLNLESRWFRRLLWLSGGIIFLMLLLYVLRTGSFQYYAAQLYDVEEGVASYQGFSRSTLVLFFALLAISNSTKQQVCVVVSALFVLFVLSARSEFAAFVVSVSVLFMIRSRKDKKKLLAVVSVGFFVLFSSAFFYEKVSQSRHAKALDLASDSSWQVRKALISKAWERVGESPLLGEFGGHVKSEGKGGYAHNILSVWDSFGLIGFLGFLVLALVPLFNSMKYVFLERHVMHAQVMLLLASVSVVVLVLVAKSVYWSLPALVWGMYFAAERVARHEK